MQVAASLESFVPLPCVCIVHIPSQSSTISEMVAFPWPSGSSLLTPSEIGSPMFIEPVLDDLPRRMSLGFRQVDCGYPLNVGIAGA